MRLFVTSLVMLLLAAVPAFAESSAIKITEAVITSKIVKGKPIDSIKRLSAGTDKNLYCFTRTLMAPGAESRLKHVWYNGDEKAAEFELPIKGDKWRTYSKKLIKKGWAGDWRVEILDESGNKLKTVKFRMN